MNMEKWTKRRQTLAKRLTSPLRDAGAKSVRSGDASFELLSDILNILNQQNSSHVDDVCERAPGSFKGRKVVEHTFLICDEFGLDPSVAYQATEILNRFLLKHTEDLLSRRPPGAARGTAEELVYQSLREKLCLFIVSSVQIASKVTLHANVIDNNCALRYLRLVGSDCPKAQILQAELLILRTLDFHVNIPSPLIYVETLLEVLGHGDLAALTVHLHHLCMYVLQLVYLQRESIYGSLLTAVTGSLGPTKDQQAKFVPVTEDFMLLGVGVIAVAAFVYQISTFQKVVEQLSGITGISAKSIVGFAHVTIGHITASDVKNVRKRAFD